MVKETLTEKALKLLGKRSAEARILAKHAFLEEKTGIRKVDEAIEQYISKWEDTTHPGLLALASEAVGGNAEETVLLQAALSYIDATMDIHDDIIDESLAKKNTKTIYGKLGKEATLLVGDAFMVKGFNRLCAALENRPKDLRSEIMNTVRNFLTEVVEAHILESELKDKKWEINPEDYLKVLSHKAADIEGRMRIGALFGGGSFEELCALSKFGRNLGILLAVRSDFVDIFEPRELMHRVKYECLPLPVIYALQDVQRKKQIRTLLLKEALRKEDCSDLVELISEIEEITKLKSLLSDLEKEAVYALRALHKSLAKNQLRLLAASMLEEL